MRPSLAPLLIAVLLGCSAPAIDTSSDESMQTSIEQVRSSLPEEVRPRFDEALTEVAMSGMALDELISSAFIDGETATPSDMTARVKESLEGRTGREIIELADSIRQARTEAERMEGLRKIAELEERKAETEAAEAELVKFEVLRARFWKERDYFGSLEPRIRLTVTNATEHPISRAYFTGTLKSVGRSIPWLSEEFNYQIRGGLEPGEEATWTLAPNQFTEWGRVDVPDDAVFTVEVERLDGPDGEPLFSTFGFTDADAEQLAELRRQYSTR